VLKNSRLSILVAGLAAVGSFALPTEAAAAAPQCTPKKMQEILAPAGPGKNSDVNIDCSVNLGPGQVVTKRLRLIGSSASGVQVTCRGATIGKPGSKGRTITIRSEPARGSRSGWAAPSNITFEGCNVYGTIIIYGMGANSRIKELQESSRDKDHKARAQSAAPSNITFRRMFLRATGNSALYVSPGVTRVRLLESDVQGNSEHSAIYLAAETSHNELRSNRIMVDTKSREQVSVDGSANNIIADNWFASLENGGIYLYRNCGEDGMIRHQGPQRNKITGNVFYYKNYRGNNPAIWLASRNGNRNYCGADKGYNFGSSANDRDFARFNEVTGNRFVERPPRQVIKIDDEPNEISRNSSITPGEAEAWVKANPVGRRQ
jgi:hypothetical protein